MDHRLSPRDYRASLDFLFARTTGQWKLGLERVTAFLAGIGDPHRRLRTLHVAGTNGKGSACAALEAMLRARGLRVAKYTSPHLVDFRERFLIDGVPVPEEAIVAFLDRWTPTVERLGATFFEATTAMAFQLFADAAVDVAVIETGLGGRLDATNVITPLVAGVTGIAIDHVEWLGTTREAIAPEKAGIYKDGVPAVVGEPEAVIRGVLAAEAARRGATPIRIVAEEGSAEGIRVDASGTSFRWTREGRAVPVTVGIPGRHQANNAMVALTMNECLPGDLRVPEPEAIAALASVSLPGRFSRRGDWLFDVAHNAQGAAVTAETLRAVSPEGPVVALVSILGDKDWRGMLQALAPAVSHLVLTDTPTAPASRAWRAEEVLAFAQGEGWSAELVRDFDAALAAADARGRTVLVTGSFHTVGDAMARLGIAPHAP